MAEFSDDSQSFKLSSPPFLDVVSTMEYTDQFNYLNTIVLNTPTHSLHRLMDFSGDSFLPQQPEFPDPFSENLCDFPSSFPVYQPVVSTGEENQQSKKRKATAVSSTCSGKSSSQVSDIGFEEGNKTNRKQCLVRGKRGKGNEKHEEGPKEVIHVRARRGQATDSHSLAERVRREKINNRMRCLRDLVPGCRKTMGMAVMLDEIINYVQSLQNQVEFLSMKLSAASYFYDFSSDMDSGGAVQTTTSYIQTLESDTLN